MGVGGRYVRVGMGGGMGEGRGEVWESMGDGRCGGMGGGDMGGYRRGKYGGMGEVLEGRVWEGVWGEGIG